MAHRGLEDGAGSPWPGRTYEVKKGKNGEFGLKNLKMHRKGFGGYVHAGLDIGGFAMRSCDAVVHEDEKGIHRHLTDSFAGNTELVICTGKPGASLRDLLT